MKKRLLIACLISVAATANSSAAIIIANAGFEADNLADATDFFTCSLGAAKNTVLNCTIGRWATTGS